MCRIRHGPRDRRSCRASEAARAISARCEQRRIVGGLRRLDTNVIEQTGAAARHRRCLPRLSRASCSHFSLETKTANPARHGLPGGRSGRARRRARPTGSRARARTLAARRRGERRTHRRRSQHRRARFRREPDVDGEPRRAGSGGAGHVSTADCPEMWRGEIDGSWITRRRFEMPRRTAPGSARAGGEDRRRRAQPLSCSLSRRPSATSLRRFAMGAGSGALPCSSTRVRSRGELGHRRFRRSESADPLAGAARRRVHRLESAACARAGGSAARESYSASNRHFLNVLYIAVPAVPEFRDCAAARARVAEPEFRGSSATTLRASPQVDYQGVAELKFEMLELAVSRFSRAASGAAKPSAPRRSAASSRRRHSAASCTRGSMRSIGICGCAGHALGLAELARRVPRSAWSGGVRVCGRACARGRVLSVPAMVGA